MKDRTLLAEVALGLTPPDMVFACPRLYNPWILSIEEGAVWVRNGRVARISKLDEIPGGVPVVELNQGIAVPGLIDGHIHFESSLLSPEAFAAVATRHGVTSIVTDYHEIGCVLGYRGIVEMADRFKNTPLKVWGLSPCPLPFIPEYEQTRASLSADEVRKLLKRRDFLGISEVIGAELAKLEPGLLRAVGIALEEGRLVEGHLFRTFGGSLDACIDLGVFSDHEPRAVDEVIEKLRRGISVMLRQGTIAREVERLAPPLAASGIDLHNVSFVTDDMLPTDIGRFGYFSDRLAKVCREGYPPLMALRAVTLASAQHYGIDGEVGSLKPGCSADLAVIEDLVSFKVLKAYVNGAEIADRQYEALPEYPRDFLSTIDFAQSTEDIVKSIALRCPDGRRRVKALELDEATRFTNLTDRDIDFAGGVPDLSHTDAAIVACVNRTTGRTGFGFLAGYGLTGGAVALSMAHDHHNIVMVGKDFESMGTALSRLRDLGGGIVVAEGEAIRGTYPMPIAGLLSTLPPEEAGIRLDCIRELLLSLGAKWSQPLFFLFFIAMPVAPYYRITENGVLDTHGNTIIDIFG